MKSVKEIKEMKSEYNESENLDYNANGRAIHRIFNILIGITEHLDAAENPRTHRAWGQQVDPEVQDVIDRLSAAEARQKKIEEWTEKFQKATCVKMPLEDAIDLPTYTEQIRRKGMIEALRWGLGRSANERLNAIDRLENGGDL